MDKKRIYEWIDGGIEPNSSNIYNTLINTLREKDIKTSSRDMLLLFQALTEKSSKWDKEIDKVINIK
jgi:hypothetical protein